MANFVTPYLRRRLRTFEEVVEEKNRREFSSAVVEKYRDLARQFPMIEPELRQVPWDFMGRIVDQAWVEKIDPERTAILCLHKWRGFKQSRAVHLYDRAHPGGEPAA